MDIININWIDVLAVIILFRMGYVGFRLGIFSEFVKLTGLVGGIFVSFRYYQGAGDALRTQVPLPTELAAALTMAGLVMLTYLGIVGVLRLAQRIVQVNFKSTLNQAGGILVGVFRAAVVTSLILVVFQQVPSEYLKASIEEKSFSGKVLCQVAPAVYDGMWPLFRRVVRAALQV